MWSTSCNLLAERQDADQLAVDDLSAQARELPPGPQRDLILAKVKELKAEVRAERQMALALKLAKREMVSNLRSALELTSAEQLLSLPREQLLDFIVRSGLGLAVDDFMQAEQRIIDAALDTLQVIVADADIGDMPEIGLVGISAAEAVFDDVILPDSLASVRSSLQSISVGVPVAQALTPLAQRLEQSTGRQLTVARTQLASVGRSAQASAAAELELDLYLYTGPRDGETRDFCRPLINKVVDEKQMRRLNNGQGLPVKTYGGGYNCRHSWSPITESFFEAANLTKATAQDITDANAGRREMIKSITGQAMVFEWVAPGPLGSAPSLTVGSSSAVVMTQTRANATVSAIGNDRRTLTVDSQATALQADQIKAHLVTDGDTIYSVTVVRMVGTTAILAEPLPREIDLSASASLVFALYYASVPSSITNTTGYYPWQVSYTLDLGQQTEQRLAKGLLKITPRHLIPGSRTMISSGNFHSSRI